MAQDSNGNKQKQVTTTAIAGTATNKSTVVSLAVVDGQIIPDTTEITVKQ